MNDPAGRTAYLAAVHAAQALIFENTDKVVTSHKGVQGEFWRLTKDEPRVNDELRAFLPRAYRFKRIADYETGPSSHISSEIAHHAIAIARRFVDCVAGLILPDGHTQHASDTRNSEHSVASLPGDASMILLRPKP